LPSRHEAKRIANQERLLALGNAVERRAGGPAPSGRSESRGTPKRGKAPRSTARRWSTRLGLTAAVLALVVVIAGVADYYYLGSLINHKHVNFLQSGSGPENILMIGSTDRCAYKVQNPMYGICQNGVNGINSDIVMVLHLNPATGQAALLSIPRDTFIPNARTAVWGYANKIDAALLQGPSQLVDALEEDFGIPINHYVELNFDTFAGVVDALGGIKMYFPMPVYDAYSQLKQYSTGCVSLNGQQALTVVRARHLQYKPNDTYSSDPSTWPQENQSDLARIRRDHEFLRVLAAAVSKQGLGDPITDAKLVSNVAPQLTVDSSLSTSDMVNMITTFHSVNSQSAPQYTLPVMASNSYSYYYQGYDYGNVEFPDNVPDLSTIQAFLNVSPNTNTMTGAPLPAASKVTVAVLNGSGVYNQASETAAALQQLGFKIGTVGDATPVGNPAETTVSYNSQNPTVVADALKVLRQISGQAILAYDPKQPAPVTVITGTSFAINTPAPAPTTSTTTHHSTTTHAASTTTAPTTTTTVPSGFAPPSSSTEPLAAWDPRSCTASGGEGP